MPLRVAPVESSAPHLIRLSIAFLLTVRASTRAQKSQIDVNEPAALARLEDLLDGRVADVLDRVEAEADVAFDDHEVVARRRSRRAAARWIPISSQRETKNGTLSFVDITLEISAAMYSAG